MRFTACSASLVLLLVSVTTHAQSGAPVAPAASGEAPAGAPPSAAPQAGFGVNGTGLEGAPPPVAAAPAPAVADGSIRDAGVHRRKLTISGLLWVPWWYGVGVGLKTGVEIPIVHDGFIPRVNDSFSLEPNFSFAYSTWSSYSYIDDLHALRFQPAMSALWSFHFSQQLRAYAAVNLGYTIVNYTDDSRFGRLNGGSYFYGELSAGVFYNFASRFAVRGELGWQGLRAGIALML